MANKDFIVKNSLIVGDTATINGVQIDPSGATSGQVLKFDGSKIVSGNVEETTSYSALFGNGTNTDYAITHNLNTKDIAVIITDVGSGEVVYARWEATSLNVVTVVLENAPTSNSKRIVVLSAGTADYHSEIIGNGTISTFDVYHNFGTSNVYVTINNASSPYENILASVRITTGNYVTVDFSSAPSLNSIRVCVFSSTKSNFYEQTTGTRVKYRIGDTGPAGGKIFITPSTPGNTTGKYFEAALGGWSGSNSDPIVSSANSTLNIATGFNIGDGKTNTDAIISAGLATTSSHAAKKAKDYTTTVDGTTYSDWFLPSYNELRRLTLYNDLVGGFDTTYSDNDYLSSSIAQVTVTTDPSPYTMSVGFSVATAYFGEFFPGSSYSENPPVNSTYGRPPSAFFESYSTSKRIRPVRSFYSDLNSSNTISHNFDTNEIAVTVRSEEDPYDILNVNWSITNSNEIELDYSYDDNTLKTVTIFSKFGGTPGIQNINDFAVEAPTYADDAGNIGEMSWDENYLYICVNKDTWKRMSLSSWD